jgi:protein-S-isoprenylcysteine O-methyltransferase Ste14
MLTDLSSLIEYVNQLRIEVVNVSKNGRSGLEAEHALCDRIQLVMLLLFFGVWTADLALHLLSTGSSVLLEFTVFPLLLIPTVLVSGFGVYLISKSHSLVFGKNAIKSDVIDCSVYSWVRHPMYLGALLFCLGFFFASLSIASFVVLIAFFFMYDKMTTFEENELIRVIGNKYVTYKNKVGKWFPKLKK